MIGIIFSILAGVAMSIQGVFNSRLSDKIGIWETNAIVQGSAFVLTLIIMFFFGNGTFKELRTVNKLYLLGGVLGVIIIFTVITGITSLGATYSIAIILVAQLTAAAIIDAFGLFDSKKLTFGMNEIIGVIIMIVGIIVFKWKH
ncbi:transporter family-2 protein [Clostridium cavendishii DSM 21758]|uniref:Transporter family-2 protein n=1 Tax=Clostridium cavendishii DSM 21758 TaxID=1121302 RepID=A0A1M6PSY2_9CLOT|nr:DMT family transporter [Clostridium cavendishii]SHK11057.1 transporter family-2 protein [Clostridium cavendishii DSM 21758]